MPYSKSTPLLLLFLLSFACQPAGTPESRPASADSDEAPSPHFSFQCATDSIRQQNALFLNVNDVTIKLADLPTCEVIPQTAYQNHQIPDSASSAAMSWHAGVYFFLVEKEKTIQVYRAMTEENPSKQLTFKRFAIYEHKKFSFTGK